MLNFLWAIAAISVIGWALGLSFHYTMGGLIHLLLGLAIISVLFRVIAGRRVV